MTKLISIILTLSLLVSSVLSQTIYTNLVVIGDSNMNDAFGQNLTSPNGQATDYFRTITGSNSYNVFGYGWPGATVTSILQKIDEALVAHPTNTFFFVSIGGNNITATRPYSQMSQTALNSLRSDLDQLFARANSVSGRMVIADLMFKPYTNSAFINCTAIFDSDTNSSRPYLDNEWRPRQIAHQPEFINVDGNSVFDLYNYLRNHWTLLMWDDGIHLNPTNSPIAFRSFIMDRCAYIFTNGTKPSYIVPMELSGKINIDLGTSAKTDYNGRSIAYYPNNWFQFNSGNIASKPIVKNLKTTTGHDRGYVSFNTSATTIDSDGTLAISGASTIKPNLAYTNWSVLSDEIMYASQSFNVSHTITMTFTNLYPDMKYRIQFTGSGTSSVERVTRITCSQNSLYDEINTSALTPEIGGFIGITDSNGEMVLTASCQSGGYGYLSGVSIQPLNPPLPQKPYRRNKIFIKNSHGNVLNLK